MLIRQLEDMLDIRFENHFNSLGQINLNGKANLGLIMDAVKQIREGQDNTTV